MTHATEDPSRSPLLQGLEEPAHVVVTGASAGIGQAACAALLAREDVACVHAISRTAEAAPTLAELAHEHPGRLHRISTDLTDAAAIDALPARIGRHSDTLHLVFNAAGVLHAHDLQPEKSLAAVTREALDRAFALNAFAPVLLARALLPMLPRRAPAVLASVSARVGSIGDNRLGGWYAYRAAKAAQNQLFRTLAIELHRSHPEACCLLLHPGTVDTALSRPFQANVPAAQLFTAGRAARQLLDIVSGATAADSGRFLAWDGSEIPW